MELDDKMTARQMMAGMFALLQRQQEMQEEMRMQRQVQPDLKVKGVEMPKYHGGLDESLELFFFHAQKYCQSQNIDMHVIKIVEEFTNYADVQRNLIDKKISDIVCYELKKKISRKTEEEEVVDYFCQ
ncbi:uncharacterized protein PHALS_03493 [Plasmopara halstedii]|uniref:Uncharacterized protein n=1 Tax=Plasmopara halstedii TaxID=4781 RepID=A0A0P1AWN6_PLAHL|nr:uncharacterized protein PHALS_03493 [Plasmopara halstedii]CEG46813.1 hypothetical protein PHALS_03493 [Plasmopara halstedii]|eukprot:XP_024583182.1 hypothetical protein PHALS_03493 [Plasmopara halstedii]